MLSNIVTVLCFIGMVVPATLGQMICYPFSKKACMKFSNYIEFVLGPRLWRVLHVYKKFNFWIYDDNMDKLPEQFMIITNHQSLLDIPCFMNVFQNRELRFVAKDALGNSVPLVSKMLKTQEHCIIPRKAKPMDAMNLMSAFGKRVKERNQIPVIFPEGTRTRDGELGKFYSAGFRKLSEASELPVVVCAIDGGYSLRDLTKVLTNLHKGCYRVKVVKIYDNPKTKEDSIKILDESRELISQQVKEWRKLSTDVK